MEIINQHKSEIENGFVYFSTLVKTVGESTKTNDKLKALQNYFTTANNADKVWTIAIFTGRRPKRIVNSRLLKAWCIEIAQIPEWLFEESYNTVGDLAETITLLLTQKWKIKPTINALKSTSLAYYLQQFILLEKADENAKKEFVLQCWQQMKATEQFVFNKLITGGFRIGVSQSLMVNALSNVLAKEPSEIALKIGGNWNANAITWEELLLKTEVENIDISKPYPFYLSYAITDPVQNLGNIQEWQAEWKWDGIRGQIIKRNNLLFVWSRGEELITEKFPEFKFLLEHLPNGTVLDGEIIAIPPYENQVKLPASFAALQTRITRKSITKKIIETAPVGFIAYDVLEYDGKDIRQTILKKRRKHLDDIFSNIQHPHFYTSPIISANSWNALIDIRKDSRNFGAEGLMLKKLSSSYQTGRKVGDWYKWKIEPMVIDAVMLYAQKGHGRRSNLFTDYTFAVKNGDKLVTFAKAYSGLTDKEFIEVDAFVKANCVEKFGPVRTVKPKLVFEIAFEGIAISNRHKSGVALRFPRINRWRKDKPVEEINTLDDLKKFLKVNG